MNETAFFVLGKEYIIILFEHERMDVKEMK
jgi:hypothetical protein